MNGWLSKIGGMISSQKSEEKTLTYKKAEVLQVRFEAQEPDFKPILEKLRAAFHTRALAEKDIIEMIQQDISVATGQEMLTEIDGDQREFLNSLFQQMLGSSEKVEKDIADHRHWLDQYTKVPIPPMPAPGQLQRLMEQ